MDAREEQENAGGSLAGDNIRDIFLSKELLCGSDTISRDTPPRMRRFAHYRESIQCSRSLGSGEEGVLVLTVIKGVEYAVKVYKQQILPYFIGSTDAIALSHRF